MTTLDLNVRENSHSVFVYPFALCMLAASWLIPASAFAQSSAPKADDQATKPVLRKMKGLVEEEFRVPTTDDTPEKKETQLEKRAAKRKLRQLVPQPTYNPYIDKVPPIAGWGCAGAAGWSATSRIARRRGPRADERRPVGECLAHQPGGRRLQQRCDEPRQRRCHLCGLHKRGHLEDDQCHQCVAHLDTPDRRVGFAFDWLDRHGPDGCHEQHAGGGRGTDKLAGRSRRQQHRPVAHNRRRRQLERGGWRHSGGQGHFRGRRPRFGHRGFREHCRHIDLRQYRHLPQHGHGGEFHQDFQLFALDGDQRPVWGPGI